MYSTIHDLLCRLGDFLMSLPGSTIIRSFIALIPVIIVYVVPLFFVICAVNSYRVRKQYVTTGWLKFILILFCIDGLFYTIFVYHSPNAAYPLLLIVLEIIIAIVLFIVFMASCGKEYGKAIRLFVDCFFTGYGFGLLTNLCLAMWGWGFEVIWLRVLAVIIFIIGVIKVILM